MSLKLDIGGGDHPIEGFVNIDRKVGKEAFPLEYADESVDEIHASHILEHFSYADAKIALKEWHRVLKPGGIMRIAVPDLNKVTKSTPLTGDAIWRFQLMGGQTDENDFHRSCWTDDLLGAHLLEAGLVELQPWVSDNGSCANQPISLNLRGRKLNPGETPAAEKEPGKIKIAAVTSIPRVGWNDAWGVMFDALRHFGIPLRRFTGVYWGQCMQRVLEGCVADDLDWILTIDYDTMFTAEHLDRLMHTFGQRPDIDALAALQCRRAKDTPLCTVPGEKDKMIDGTPFKVATAHFGLTLLRVESLKKCAKPWFWAKPDEKGEWGDNRLDDDIWFWQQWREAGNTVYVDPSVAVGHLEVVVADFATTFEAKRIHPTDWIETHKKDERFWRT